MAVRRTAFRRVILTHYLAVVAWFKSVDACFIDPLWPTRVNNIKSARRMKGLLSMRSALYRLVPLFAYPACFLHIFRAANSMFLRMVRHLSCTQCEYEKIGKLNRCVNPARSRKDESSSLILAREFSVKGKLYTCILSIYWWYR